MQDQLKVNWIAVDWGTSNLRAWTLDIDGNILDEAQSDQGMGKLKPQEFEAALLACISPWLKADKITPVVCCGMVGARQGWVEAPYQAVPCSLTNHSGYVAVKNTDRRMHVYILPGVKQKKPADVMRGEETQIAGFLASNTDFDGVICLPGTHTKWVRIRENKIVNFATFMTGELFSLLSSQSVLRHSVNEVGWNEEAFMYSLNNTMSTPQRLTQKLFGLRAQTLLEDVEPSATRARLSGMLIGTELDACRFFWLQHPVVILGAKTLAKTYQRALIAQGVQPTIEDGKTTVLAGLKAAYSNLKEKKVI